MKETKLGMLVAHMRHGWDSLDFEAVWPEIPRGHAPLELVELGQCTG